MFASNSKCFQKNNLQVLLLFLPRSNVYWRLLEDLIYVRWTMCPRFLFPVIPLGRSKGKCYTFKVFSSGSHFFQWILVIFWETNITKAPYKVLKGEASLRKICKLATFLRCFKSSYLGNSGKMNLKYRW